MDERLLLKIARDSINEEFGGTKVGRDALLTEHKELNEDGAVFVTLTQNGQLRGCIGSLVAHRKLLDDVIHNAKAAAFSDPRFHPLKENEADSVHIEISILSTPEPLQYKDIADLKSKIRPNIDGIILKSGYSQATFLPQVWEQLPDFDLFFAHLCAKAGLEKECLKRHPEIYTYQAKKIKE